MKENVQTDDLHLSMLFSGLYAAKTSIEDDEMFLIGYLEGITRLALLLMGDYPNHRKRRGGRKKKDHYDLKRCRKLIYTQDSQQKLFTLLAASNTGFIELKKDPMEALREFRDIFGNKASYEDFFRWYKDEYSDDYASVF